MQKTNTIQTRVMVADGNNIFGRAWFSINYRGDVKAPVKKAVDLFKTMIVNLRKAHITDLLIICWDEGKDPDRMTMFPNYKQRKEKPSGYYNALALVQEEVAKVCNQYIQIKIKNVEADDLIATLANYYSILNCMVIIVSDDKDMLQLINENVVIAHSKRGIIDAIKFKERFNFKPKYFVDYLAMLGDKIDNIPGIKGIGKVGAKNLIQEFGTIEEVYNNIACAPQKYIKKLQEARNDAFLSKKLIKLKTINIPTNKLVDPETSLLAPVSESIHENTMEIMF